MKTLTTTVARILFGMPFLIFGINHFVFADQMKMALPSYLPGGIFWIYITGIGLIAGAISLYIEKLTKQAMIGIAVFLISTIAIIQVPNLGNPDPMMMQMAMSGLFKDLGLLGGALVYLGIYSNNKKQS